MKIVLHQRKVPAKWLAGSLVAVAFAAAGVSYLVLSHAGTPAIAFEPETGALRGGATIGTDKEASGGKYVEYHGQSAPLPGNGGKVPHGPAGSWSLTFDDEFDGNKLDSSKWESTWFGDGSTMNNVGTYANNVSVGGGEASLQLASSSSGALIHTGYQPGHYQFPVGSYVEARILFPGNGAAINNWPAWWANSTNNYPASGEHDIAEGLSTLTVNYHSPSGAYNMGTIPGVWSNAFHTYGLLRQAGKAEVYWDGQLVKSYTTDDDGQPEDLILNIGSGEGPTVTGAAGAMRVDYVRAWKPN